MDPQGGAPTITTQPPPADRRHLWARATPPVSNSTTWMSSSPTSWTSSSASSGPGLRPAEPRADAADLRGHGRLSMGRRRLRHDPAVLLLLPSVMVRRTPGDVVHVQRLWAIHDLNLKFVVDHGTILRQHVAAARSCRSDVIREPAAQEPRRRGDRASRRTPWSTEPCAPCDGRRRRRPGRAPRATVRARRGWCRCGSTTSSRAGRRSRRTRVIVEEGHVMYRADLPTSVPGRRCESATWSMVAGQAGVTGVDGLSARKPQGRGRHERSACTARSIEELLHRRTHDYFTIRNMVPTPMEITSCRRPSSSRRRRRTTAPGGS